MLLDPDLAIYFACSMFTYYVFKVLRLIIGDEFGVKGRKLQF